MSMKTFERLNDMLCEELDEIVAKGELSSQSLQTVDTIMHCMKNTYKVMECEENSMSMRGGASYGRGGDWEARGTYSRGRSMSMDYEQEPGRERTAMGYGDRPSYRMR